MIDAIVAGAGPAGAMAALVLARAGARVVLVDRDEFPRDKLCGDTLNPGAVRLLAGHGLMGGPLDDALRLGGMCVTGPSATVHARYDGTRAVAVTRRTFDHWLIQQAVAAGARFESGHTVRGPLVEDRAGVPIIRGVIVDRPGRSESLRLPGVITIAADGRRSTLARATGLVRPPSPPQRWAYGTYATGVAGLTDEGEMHIRHGWYMGIAPVGGGVANICVVRRRAAAGGRRPIDVVRESIAADAALGARFVDADIDERVRVLGPLSSETTAAGAAGLLLAGDAAGFVDPLTGDGIHLALRGGVLAAGEALRALETGDVYGAAARLFAARRAALGWKTRFNRAVRQIVDSTAAVDAANAIVRFVPGLLRGAIRYAGEAP